MSDYIKRTDVQNALKRVNYVFEATERGVFNALARVPAADVAPVVRLGKDRLTKLGVNGIYGLVKVKDNEQEVDSPHRNTLAAILECFQRLAEYENAEFGDFKIDNRQYISVDDAMPNSGEVVEIAKIETWIAEYDPEHNWASPWALIENGAKTGWMRRFEGVTHWRGPVAAEGGKE